MAVEAPGLWKDLNAAWPEDDDDCFEGDDHIRLLKASNLIQFPNLEDAVTSTADELNSLVGAAANNPLQAQLDALDTTVQSLVADVANSLHTIGDIKLRASATPETNWLLCDGALYNPAAYPDLAALLGTTFGGDGVVTFGVPDLRGRSPLGFGQGDTAEGGGSGTTRTFGEKVGAETHTLTEAELASHNHALSYATNPAASGGFAARGDIQSLGVTTNNRGGDQPHNNMAPVTVLGFYIKAL